MERICEPELMEGLAQAQAYGAADFSATDQSLVERLAELLAEIGANVAQVVACSDVEP